MIFALTKKVYWASFCFHSFNVFIENNKNMATNEWNLKNKERMKEYRKEWNKINGDKIKKYRETFNEKHPDADKISTKKWRERNPEYTKQWRKSNPTYNNDWVKKKCNEDPIFRFKYNIREVIRRSLKRQNFKKNSTTQQILGCTLNEFKQYIESQFEPWMNWENRGKRIVTTQNTSWDIDHIIPISSAKTEEEIIKLSHYTNLRPLCSYYNRFIKRNLIE